MSTELERALEEIRVSELHPHRPDDEPVPDHAPNLIADLERMVAERQDGAA